MKKYFLVLITLCVFLHPSLGQFKTPPIDKSPMDMMYFPSGFAQLKAQGKATGDPIMRVIYGRPQKNGREIFGSHLPYGKLWRAGANEATEVTFFKAVIIGEKEVQPGRYSLYIIPEETKWTLILNSETDIWGEGPSKYDQNKDVIRTELALEKLDADVEAWSMFFQKSEFGANLVMAWDKTKTMLPITIK